MGVDGFGVERAVGRVKGPGGGEERFDSCVAKNEERGDRAEAAGERLVAAGVSDPANDVLAAKLFEVVGGVAGTLWWAAFTHPRGDVGGGEAVG